MNMNEVTKSVKGVQAFGFPLSNERCAVCHGRMYYVGNVIKRFGTVDYKFDGYKCGFCGHEHAKHVEGGALGYVKE